MARFRDSMFRDCGILEAAQELSRLLGVEVPTSATMIEDSVFWWLEAARRRVEAANWRFGMCVG